MALVPVEIVNKSGSTVRMTVDDGEQLDYLRKLVRAEDLDSVKLITPARKSAAGK